MKRIKLEKSSIFLLIIIALIVGAIAFLVLRLRADSVDEALKNDRILNIAFVVERGGKPLATEIFFYYPMNQRGAILDVPAETGLILKSLNRMDRIDALYESRNPKPYIEEVSKLIGTPLPFYIVLDEPALVRLVDLLDGLPLFIPNPVDADTPKGHVLLPSGSVVLDGDKAAAFAAYDDPDAPDLEKVERRQRILQTLLSRIGDRKDYVLSKSVFPEIFKCFRTNMESEALYSLFGRIAGLDVDRLVTQRITGVRREVDGSTLLFPHYDGGLVKDIVKQTLNALVNADSFAVADKVFTIEILNGTTQRGMAGKTAEIFQSFGYEVGTVDNAETQDVAKTIIYDRYSNGEAAKTIGNVIHCKNIVSGDAGRPESFADFILILGDDFNGRFCAN
jgi:polyisoprenyl-teichoic acid--peptidoglycan teichoic acid transferase